MCQNVGKTIPKAVVYFFFTHSKNLRNIMTIWHKCHNLSCSIPRHHPLCPSTLCIAQVSPRSACNLQLVRVRRFNGGSAIRTSGGGVRLQHRAKSAGLSQMGTADLQPRRLHTRRRGVSADRQTQKGFWGRRGFVQIFDYKMQTGDELSEHTLEPRG